MADLTITIVLYNSADVLGACLDSLQEDLAAGLVNLVAVDNASPDESAALFRSRVPDAPLLRSGQNLGFAGGCNLSWPLVQSRYWLLLNPDTVVPRGLIRRMLHWLDANRSVGAASPHMTGPDGELASAARRFPSVALSLLELSRVHLLLPPALRGRTLLGSYLTGTPETEADWVPGTAMFLRREAVQAVGLLNESLFMYGEDIEYCWRVRRAGWSVRLPAVLTIQHRGGTSADRTWGRQEASRRTLEGWFGACAVLKGRRYTRLLLALGWCALKIDTALPWRTAETRASARRTAAMYRSLLVRH